jgi:hypothetical protein
MSKSEEEEWLEKLIHSDIKKWNKIETEVLQPIVKKEKELGLF